MRRAGLRGAPGIGDKAVIGNGDLLGGGPCEVPRVDQEPD